LAKKQFVPPKAGLRIRLEKWGEISGTRFARPTLWVLLYLFLQNWSVFTTSLEPILSKIRNERKPRHCLAPLGNPKEKCSLLFGFARD